MQFHREQNDTHGHHLVDDAGRPLQLPFAFPEHADAMANALNAANPDNGPLATDPATAAAAPCVTPECECGRENDE